MGFDLCVRDGGQALHLSSVLVPGVEYQQNVQVGRRTGYRTWQSWQKPGCNFSCKKSLSTDGPLLTSRDNDRCNSNGVVWVPSGTIHAPSSGSTVGLPARLAHLRFGSIRAGTARVLRWNPRIVRVASWDIEISVLLCEQILAKFLSLHW
jgi:hypothetical protein